MHEDAVRRLKRLDSRCRAGCGMSMLENLESIKRNGIRRFATDEKVRWACSERGGVI